MAKKIVQFRYYGEGKTNKNYPSDISAQKLQYGSIFVNHDCLPITQLGIQTLPGTKFYLNNSLTPIVIGSTGIYELDLENITEINYINFDKQSLQIINNSENAYLIIDMVCGGN